MQQALTTLERVINRALALQALDAKAFNQLEDKSLRIECAQPAIDLVIQVKNQQFQLFTYAAWCDNHAAQFTAHLQGDIFAFAKLVAAEDKAAALINADLRFFGDSHFLMALQQRLMSLGVDWEYQLARVVGDIPAYLVSQWGKGTVQWLKNTYPIFVRHSIEFVTEEAALLPSHLAMEDHIGRIQALDLRIERLEAKVGRLAKNALKS